MATFYNEGSNSVASLSASFGLGISFDANLSGVASLSYDTTGEFEASLSSVASLEANVEVVSGLYDNAILARSALRGDFASGKTFNFDLKSKATLTAESLLGNSFDASLTGKATLNADILIGRVFDTRQFESVATLLAESGIAVSSSSIIWVVNLATGGHAYYTGDLTGATPVSAYAVTGTHQLGSDRAKYVHDVYTHMRIDGEAEITTMVDEQKTPDPYLVEFDDRTGIHRRRTKIAKGLKGTNWQFKVANVAGSSITLKTLEVPPVESQRVR